MSHDEPLEIRRRLEVRVVCEACGGSGWREEMREVSREMALDAGDPCLEGQPIPDRGRCENCSGDGLT